MHTASGESATKKPHKMKKTADFVGGFPHYGRADAASGKEPLILLLWFLFCAEGGRPNMLTIG